MWSLGPTMRSYEAGNTHKGVVCSFAPRGPGACEHVPTAPLALRTARTAVSAVNTMNALRQAAAVGGVAYGQAPCFIRPLMGVQAFESIVRRFCGSKHMHTHTQPPPSAGWHKNSTARWPRGEQGLGLPRDPCEVPELVWPRLPPQVRPATPPARRQAGGGIAGTAGLQGSEGSGADSHGAAPIECVFPVGSSVAGSRTQHVRTGLTLAFSLFTVQRSPRGVAKRCRQQWPRLGDVYCHDPTRW